MRKSSINKKSENNENIPSLKRSTAAAGAILDLTQDSLEDRVKILEKEVQDLQKLVRECQKALLDINHMLEDDMEEDGSYEGLENTTNWKKTKY